MAFAPGTVASATAICVVATSAAATRAAIVTASALAQPLDGRVHVITARVMPADRSLAEQALPVQAFAKDIRPLTADVHAQIDVLPCVCRRMTDIAQIIPHGSIVIVAGPSRRWWPSREQRLAHDLTALGFRVVFVHAPDGASAA